MSLATTFERSFILHQPKSLKCLTARFVAIHVIMITDCLQSKFTNLEPGLQHLIAPHLYGKWFTQFIALNESLLHIEKAMDSTDKTKANTLTFLYKFFCNLPSPHLKTFTFHSLMAECYISEKCNTLDYFPTKLYHLGVRDNLKVMSFEVLEPCSHYFSCCSINFTPSLDPLPANSNFYQFDNAIYAMYKPFIVQPVATNWKKHEEIPRRMSWAHYFYAHDRIPEALVQILCCLSVINADNNSRLEYLDMMSLLILVAAKLHFNIECQTYVVLSALSLISLSFEICELIPGIITMFSELGNFEWCKIIFYKFPVKNKYSRYYSQSLYAYADSLIEYIENICMSIIGLSEYHNRCRPFHCKHLEGYGVYRQKVYTLLSELNLIINKMLPAPETDLFKAQFALLKSFMCNVDNYDRKYQSCLSEAYGLMGQVLENYPNKLTKTKAQIINSVLKSHGPLSFREMITEQMGRLNKSNVSNLKGKLLFKCIIYFFLFYKYELGTEGARTILNGYIDDTLDIFCAISNKKHYRIRLLKSCEKVFYHKMSHQNGNVVRFGIDKLKITKNASISMCQNLCPNFPFISLVPQQDLFANIPLTPACNFRTFICGPDKLINLDPFIKNHIAFGASQLKIKN